MRLKLNKCFYLYCILLLTFVDLYINDIFVIDFINSGSVIIPHRIESFFITLMGFFISNDIYIYLPISFICMVGLFNKNKVVDKYLFLSLLSILLILITVYIVGIGNFILSVRDYMGIDMKFDYTPFEFTL
mgnify:CR=1 FL=1